jgi:hypothetical protein
MGSITQNVVAFQASFGVDNYLATLRYLVTLFGSSAMYAFSLNKGFEGAIIFLKKAFPGRNEAFYSRMDFFVVSISGSIIGTIFFGPTNNLQALAAGFGWVGTVNVLLSQGGNKHG